jgi:quercetin dioxygenase-like cupin family protein
MPYDDERPYFIEGRELIAETPDLRVQILTIAEGEEIPWHYHTIISDTFTCLEGPMTVRTKRGEADLELDVGETGTVSPNIAHKVTGRDGGRCRFVIVQGIGAYDYHDGPATD